jgi:hypothetical protein
MEKLLNSIRSSWHWFLILVPVSIIISYRLQIGVWIPFFQFGDQDIHLSSSAMGFANGKNLEYLDHPGYFPILAIYLWNNLLSFFGGHSSVTFQQLHTAADFQDAIATLIAKARLLSTTLTVFTVLICSLSIGLITRSIFIGFLTGTLYALGHGVFLESIIVRTENLSIALWWCSVLVIVLQGRERSLNLRALYLVILGILIYMQLASKIQAVLLMPIFLIIPALQTLLQGRNSYIYNLRYKSIITLTALCFLIPMLLDTVPIYEFHRYHLLFGFFTLMLAGVVTYGSNIPLYLAVTCILSGTGIGYLFIQFPFTAVPHWTILNLVDRMTDMCNLNNCPVLNKDMAIEFYYRAFFRTFSTLFYNDIDKINLLVVHMMIALSVFSCVYLLYKASCIRIQKILFFFLLQAITLLYTFVVVFFLLFRWPDFPLVSYYWIYVEVCLIISVIIPLWLLFKRSNFKLELATSCLVLLVTFFVFRAHIAVYNKGDFMLLPSRQTYEAGCSHLIPGVRNSLNYLSDCHLFQEAVQKNSFRSLR